MIGKALEWATGFRNEIIIGFLLVTLGFTLGFTVEAHFFSAYKASVKNEIAEWKAKAEKINTVTITKYVDRLQTIHEKGDTILKEVPTYVPRNVCVLPADVRRLHDTAILPGASTGPDGKAQGTEGTSGKAR